jgi:hypothetical protein
MSSPRSRRTAVAVCVGGVAAAALVPLGGTPAPTRLLRQPTVSASQIAFAYANNIWSVGRQGGVARRLTSFQGQTSHPRFSPDGRWIAFSAEYAGNTDVYVAVSARPMRATPRDEVDGGVHEERGEAERDLQLAGQAFGVDERDQVAADEVAPVG